MHAHIQSSNTDSMELEECQHNKEYIICGATTQQSERAETIGSGKRRQPCRIKEAKRAWERQSKRKRRRDCIYVDLYVHGCMVQEEREKEKKVHATQEMRKWYEKAS